MGFISAVAPSQRPSVFQSLLYEACGRTVNPVFGAVGLLWGGNWATCQAAVDTVLKGGSLRAPAATDFGVGSQSNNFTPFPLPARPEKRCATDITGFSDVNQKLESAKKGRDVVLEGVRGNRAAIQSAYYPQTLEKTFENIVTGVKDDSIEVVRQWARKQEVGGDSIPFRLDFSNVQLARAGCVAASVKEEQAEEGKTNAPSILTPLARRVRPRVGVDEMRVSSRGLLELGDGQMPMVPDAGRDHVELDLTLSSSVKPAKVPKAPKLHRNVHTGRGVKRVSSPNSEESVNSEGSVTSLGSTCGLSLSHVAPVRASHGYGQDFATAAPTVSGHKVLNFFPA